VTVYAAGANGNATPTGTISGAATALNGPSDLALDTDGNIYVTNMLGNNETVYAVGTRGNTAPIFNLTGLAQPSGLAHFQDNIYVTNAANSSVTGYDDGQNGNIAPSITISGAATGLSSVHGVTVH